MDGWLDVEMFTASNRHCGNSMIAFAQQPGPGVIYGPLLIQCSEVTELKTLKM